jgi:hypothetical protein
MCNVYILTLPIITNIIIYNRPTYNNIHNNIVDIVITIIVLPLLLLEAAVEAVDCEKEEEEAVAVVLVVLVDGPVLYRLRIVASRCL